MGKKVSFGLDNTIAEKRGNEVIRDVITVVHKVLGMDFI